jgi:cAMP-binding proteins - catabolite gene activator and regulatory subunit of cAMP-dependent protein kinases
MAHHAPQTIESNKERKAKERANALHQARCQELQRLDCFRHVPIEEIQRLADQVTFRAFALGSTLLNEQQFGEFVYIILKGQVRVTLHDRDGREVQLEVLGRGDCIGESPLFGDQFRRITATIEQPSQLLQIPLSNLRELLKHSPQLNEVLHRLFRYRLSLTTLGRIPLFNKLTQVDRIWMLSLLQSVHYERGAVVVEEGTQGNALYLIEGGQAIVERQNRPIAYLDEGNFFGEMSLLEQKPHSATVRALTPLSILLLPAEGLEELLKRNPTIDKSLKATINERRATTSHMMSDQERSQELTAAMENGLLRGSTLFVRDPSLCPPDCRICEQACANRFGQTRLHLNGTPIGQLDAVTVCHQCRFGAECIEACPENALVWDERGVLIVNDQCTGCGECVEACPYDAVDLFQPKQARRNPLLQLLDAMQQRNSFELIKLEPLNTEPRANKCDLCHGHNDMACLSACPTGSLRLIPVEELFPL